MTTEVLHQAADHLATLAIAATPGPWTFYNGNLWPGDVGAALARFDAEPDNDEHWPYADDDQCQLFHGDPVRTEDAAYIAAMHPGVAIAVQDLLGDVAEAVEDRYPLPDCIIERIEAVARAINGGAE
jgi:hypothetical protein